MANLGVTLRFIFHSLDVQYKESTKDKIALQVFHAIVKLTKPGPWFFLSEFQNIVNIDPMLGGAFFNKAFSFLWLSYWLGLNNYPLGLL